MVNRLSPGCGCCDGVECDCPFSSDTFDGGAPAGKKWVLKVTVSGIPNVVHTAARRVSGGGIGGVFIDHWWDLTLTGLDAANGEYFVDLPMTEEGCIEHNPGLARLTLASGTFDVEGDSWSKVQTDGCGSASFAAVDETRDWTLEGVFSSIVALNGRMFTQQYPTTQSAAMVSTVGQSDFTCSGFGWSAPEVDIVAGIGFLTPDPFCGVDLTSTDDSKIGKIKAEVILVDE